VPLWIDADVDLTPTTSSGSGRTGCPGSAGLYAKKSRREFACAFLPNTRQVLDGPNGGVIEILDCGFGFTLISNCTWAAVMSRILGWSSSRT
jgi:hypothetical protein